MSLTAKQIARVSSLIPGNPADPDAINMVRLTSAFPVMLGDKEGEPLLDDQGSEVEVEAPVGTLCRVDETWWIGGEQGLAFNLIPVGDQFPNAIALNISEAELVNGVYPFEVAEG